MWTNDRYYLLSVLIVVGGNIKKRHCPTIGIKSCWWTNGRYYLLSLLIVVCGNTLFSDISWPDTLGMTLLRKEKFASCSLGTWRVTSREPIYQVWYFWENKNLQVIRLTHDGWHLVNRHTGDDTFEKIKICKLFSWHMTSDILWSDIPGWHFWENKNLHAIRLAHEYLQAICLPREYLQAIRLTQRYLQAILFTKRYLQAICLAQRYFASYSLGTNVFASYSLGTKVFESHSLGTR